MKTSKLRSRMRNLAAGASVLALGAVGGHAQAQKLWAFGDSLSDIGNVAGVSLGILPGADYYNGRFSNGPVWVERYGLELGGAPGLLFLNPLLPFTVDGYNFAHGGAASGDIGPLPGFLGEIFGLGAPDFLQVTQQAQYFANNVASGILSVSSSQDVFSVWSGANDYIFYETADPQNAVANIVQTLVTLYGAGARNFIVFGLPRLGETPSGVTGGQRDLLNQLSMTHNDLLESQLAMVPPSSGANILYVDAELIFDVIIGSPEIFGFNVVQPGAGTSGNCLDDGLVLGACPDSYLFYDGVHPTRSGHDLIARIVAILYDQQNAPAMAAQAKTTAVGEVQSTQSMAVRSRLAAARNGVTGISAMAAMGVSVSNAATVLPNGVALLHAQPSQTGAAGAPRWSFFSFSAGDWAPRSALGDMKFKPDAFHGGSGNSAFDAAPRYIAMGADTFIGDRFIIGGLASSNNDELRDDALNLSGQIETQTISAYTAFIGDRLSADLTVSAARDRYDLVRFTGLRELPAVFTETDSRSMTSVLGAEYLWSAGGVSFGPQARIAYSDIRFDGYEETGSLGIFDIDQGADRRSGASIYAGIRIAGSLSTHRDEARLTVSANAGVISNVYGASILSPIIDTPELARAMRFDDRNMRYAGRAGVNVSYAPTDRLRLRIDADAIAAPDRAAGIGRFSATLRF